MSPALDRIATPNLAPPSTGAEVSAVPDVYEGEVSRVEGDDVFVTIPEFSVSREHGPTLTVAPAGQPMVGDEVAVAFTDGRRPLAFFPGAAVKRDQMPLHVYDFGVNGEGDDSADYQDAIDEAQTTGRALLSPGDYDVQGLTAVSMKPLAIRGEKKAVSGTGPMRSRLRRTTAGVALFTAEGAAYGDRVLLDWSDLELNGGGVGGTLLATHRVSDGTFRNLYLHDCPATAWHRKQMFNSSCYGLRVQTCGSGTASPAMLADAYAESQGGCDGNTFFDSRFLGNSGTEMKFTGRNQDSPTINAPATNEDWIGLALESGVTGAENSPFIDLDWDQWLRFIGVTITNGALARTVPLIRKTGQGTGGSVSNDTGTAADIFDGLSINSDNASGPSYLIDFARGSLELWAWNAAVQHSITALVRIQSTVFAGRFNASDPITNTTAAKMFSDLRTAPEYPRLLAGSKSHDWGAVADGASASTTVTVTGATTDMRARAAHAKAAAGVFLSASVTAADTVTVSLFNKSGGALTAGASTLRADAVR